MPSLSWRPSPLGIASSVAQSPIEGGPDVVAIVGLEHDVVQALWEFERRPRERDRVVPRLQW